MAKYLCNFNQLQERAMIRVKDHKQGEIFDPWAYLGPKRRKLLDESWAGLFREHIVEDLPVEVFVKFFSDDMGRPTKELSSLMGAVLLQQTLDLSDEETVEQMAFSEQWHYALNITEESDDAKYICLKTLYNAHRIFVDHHIDAAVFNRVSEKLAKVFDVDTTKQRLDSVHIKSNMARLGRIGIIVRSINKFLTNLKRQHEELLDDLSQELTVKYLGERALSCFSMVKPSESGKTLAEVAQDLYSLIEHFAGMADVASMYSYKLLLRVLDEQCTVNKSPDGESVEVGAKPAKDVASDSLQNPSDPEAGYDGHKGQGYQVQVMETYGNDNDDPNDKAQRLDLITYVDVESASEHDSHALLPALQSTDERGLAPKEVLADSLYGSDDNIEDASEMGVEVVSPALGTTKAGALGLDAFAFTQDGRVQCCPAGHAPVKVKTNKNKRRHSVAFDSDRCTHCPLVDRCPVRPGKKHHHYLRYRDKDLRLSLRRAFEQTEAFKQRYRMRSGVEATMSQFDRLTGVKRLRVRGIKAVRFCSTLKATGVNIFRATAVRKARKAAIPGPEGLFSLHFRPVSVFKELLSAIFPGRSESFFPVAANSQFYAQMAF